ncbi:MAG TPA: glycosyltransferase family 92 protein [Parachlamydiaceae bacterium]|nr:glycosyltransferase family 92 protein [Parachlamydiaceae bacterium]
MRFIKILLCLIFFKTSYLLSFGCELAVCAVFKDEGPYLREWVCFHRAQGVDRFYLYDYLSCDDWRCQIEDFICSGVVQIIPWGFNGCHFESFEEVRCKAYKHCLDCIRHDVKWCAFLDCNEFLFCPSAWPLPVFLKKFKKCPCICISRQVYGTSFVDQTACGCLVRSLLWKCLPKHSCCEPVRCLVQPKYVKDCTCSRWFILKHGSDTFNPNKKKVKEHDKKEICINKIRINCYICRDLLFFNNRRESFCCEDFNRSYGFNFNLNCVYDDCILNCCPPLLY